MNFNEKTKSVEMGCETLHISKMYGPLIFCDIRVTADFNTCSWVIERERIDKDGNTTWEEMCRFHGQERIEFHND